MFGLRANNSNVSKTDISPPRIKKGEDRNLRLYPRFAEKKYDGKVWTALKKGRVKYNP